jgi:hypothetical protein
MPLPTAEDLTIRAFIIRDRRDRFLELLANPKRRRKITDSLAHPNPAWFDSRFVKRIPPSHDSNAGIENLLRAKGTGRACWVICEDQKMDGREIELSEILAHVGGRGIGTIVCCIPGKLAFVESEDGRFILEK